MRRSNTVSTDKNPTQHRGGYGLHVHGCVLSMWTPNRKQHGLSKWQVWQTDPAAYPKQPALSCSDHFSCLHPCMLTSHKTTGKHAFSTRKRIPRSQVETVYPPLHCRCPSANCYAIGEEPSRNTPTFLDRRSVNVTDVCLAPVSCAMRTFGQRTCAMQVGLESYGSSNSNIFYSVHHRSGAA